MISIFRSLLILTTVPCLALTKQGLSLSGIATTKSAQEVQPSQVHPDKILALKIENLKKRSGIYLDKIQSLKEIGNISKRLDSGGAMDGGGGQTIILKSGHALLVDLITSPLAEQDIASHSDIEKLLFSRNKRVKNIAQDFAGFFSCGQQRFRALPFKVLHELAGQTEEIKPLAVEFRLASLNREQMSENIQNLLSSLPVIATPSPSFDEKIQEPVAAYQKSRLWISKRIYQRMAAQDQCALQVHESLRHLNRIKKFSIVLKTDDIEAITRFVMGTSSVVPTILKKIEAEYLTRNSRALQSTMREMETLKSSIGQIMFDRNQKFYRELEGTYWSLFNALSDLNALDVLSKIEDLTLELDYISSPRTELLEVYLKQDGLWDAATGYRYR